ncbi:unnamed protein product, partial [Meganyctiphanes norvegica]
MGEGSKVIEGGFFITKKLAICIVAIFAISKVAVGLMVHFLPPDPISNEILLIEVTSIATTEDPSVTTEAPLIDVRLSGSLIPYHYVVHLRPWLSGDFKIEGYVEIYMECVNQTTEVSIHMADIITHNDTIKLIQSDAMEKDEIDISSHTYDSQREFYIANLAESLIPGQNYTIKMNFTGLLNDQLRGFYRSIYTNEADEEIWLAVTQFQPTDARRAFPCFDEPALKATFDISLGHQENMTAISNMPLEMTTDMSEEGWYWDHFERTVPMSTYLVAFAISDFDHLNSTEDSDTLFTVWARPSAIEQAQYSLDIGPPMLTFFEKYYDIPFPLPKQDMIALPDFAAGAMENWGLITYRETAMLYEEGVSSANNKQRVAVVVSHELAHQWFGDLVTPSWWTDLWLNEGFASYMEYLGVDNVEPDWRMMEQFVTESLHYVFAIDCLESSHPISIPVGHPDEINEIFDSISYSKGASIIRMMQHFLSENTFKVGLTKYLNAMAYKAASQDDLWEFLTEQAVEDDALEGGLSVKEVMDTWTLQMGYPVINVQRSKDGTSATVSQVKFSVLVDN